MFRLAFAAAFALVMVALPGMQADAQPYPSQPIRIVVPTAPGGVADIVGRTFANKLTEAGHVTVVENKTGAGGAIAADFVAKAAPDGYTVYVGFHATNAILPHLQKLNYDPEKDLLPVTIAAKTANVLIVHPSVPAKTLKELVAHAKANPGKLTFASQGNGSTGHIVGEQFKEVAAIDIAHVPYRGAAPAVQDVASGQVQATFVAYGSAAALVQSGQIRAVGVAGEARMPALPEVPTLREQGIDLVAGFWWGVIGPAGLPERVAARLAAVSEQAMASPELAPRLEALAVQRRVLGPEPFRAHLRAESARWTEVVQRAGIKPE